SQLVQDARRHGVEVRPADVTASEWECTLEHEAVRLGLLMVRGLAEAAAQRIVEARVKSPFESVDDLAHRAPRDPPRLKCLARARRSRGTGARRTGRSRAPTPAGTSSPARRSRKAGRSWPLPPRERASSPTTRAPASRWDAIRWRCCARALRGCASPPPTSS